MATAQLTRDEHETRGSLSEWALQLGAMSGAAAGALAGTSLATALSSGASAAVLIGAAGTVLGSVSCALAGKYLLLPMWAAMLGASPAHRA